MSIDPEKIPCLYCGKRLNSRCADWQAAFEEHMEDKKQREKALEELAKLGQEFDADEAMEDKAQREKALEEIAKFDVENDLI